MSTVAYDRRLHGVAIYNPDLLSKDELVAHFVARGALLEQILADLRRPKFEQHQIIVGTRGMGKTTLLRRLRYAVEDDPGLSIVWMPLTFPEEQYNVGRLSDFYLNILDALGDTLEQHGRRDEASALDDAVASIPKDDETRRAQAALSLLIATAERLDRRLLLLIDNLDLVLQRLERDKSATWALREVLSKEHRILLIGAMPVVIGATYEYDAPFYDFFQVHELRGLTREETREVLRTLAKEQNAPAVERLLESDPARIDTLHVLTAGNPRTIVLLFNVLAQGTEGDVRSDLEKLLDQCTPLYKSRFESLAAQAQQVVDAVAIHWDPISAGELAEKLALDVNLVSSQLNRLVQQGVLEKVEYDPPSKTGFQVAERFFNIWYLMRASRRVRRRLIWLVQFLRLFFGAEQLRLKARDVLDGAQSDSRSEKLRHAELCLALAQVLEDDRRTRMSLESRAIRTLLMDNTLSHEISAMLDLDGTDASLREVVDRERWVEDFRHAVDALPFNDAEKERIRDLIGGAIGLSRVDRLFIVKACRVWTVEKVLELLEAAESERQTYLQHYGSRLGNQLIRACREGYWDSVDEQGAAEAAIIFNAPELGALFADSQEVGLEHLQSLMTTSADPFLKVLTASILSNRGFNDQALALLERARNHESFAFLETVHAEVCVRAGMPEQAVVSYRAGVEKSPMHVLLAWKGLAKTLKDLGRASESLEVYRRALSIRRDSAILAHFGIALLSHGQHDEAESILREALRESPDHLNASVALALLLAAKSNREAVEIVQRVALSPDLSVGDAFACIGVLFTFDAGEPALSLAKTILPKVMTDSSEAETRLIFTVIGMGVAFGYAAALRDLIEELGLQEALQPVLVALRVASGEPRAFMKRLAPEVKSAADSLLQEWKAAKTKSPKKKASNRRPPT